MANAKSSESLSDRLFDIAARLGACHQVASFLANPGCGDDQDQQGVLFLLEAQLGRLTKELTDISEGDEVCALDRREAAAIDKTTGDDDDDGSPLGEIIRSGGVAMKSALELPPSKIRNTILLAADNILDHAEQIAPDDDRLSGYSKYRKIVAAM